MGIFLSKKMHYFMVIMEHRNFAKAADILCLTRSPLSKVLAEMEDALGGKLFQRKHNKLEPTDLAWSYYERCKNIYNELMDLEKSYKKGSHTKVLNIKFDISFPEVFVRYINHIAQFDNINVKITREMITIDELTLLSLSSDLAIMSLRPLGGTNLIHCDSWQGSQIVQLSSDSEFKESNNNVFVWNDKYISYFKNRMKSILSSRGDDFKFIEHNNDISTLFYLIKAGKGTMLSPEKLFHFFNCDGIKSTKIDNEYIRCYIYTNKNLKQRHDLNLIKNIISKFI